MYQGESVGVSVLAGIQQPLKCPHPLLPPLMCPIITCPQGNYPTEVEEGRRERGWGICQTVIIHIYLRGVPGSPVQCLHRRDSPSVGGVVSVSVEIWFMASLGNQCLSPALDLHEGIFSTPRGPSIVCSPWMAASPTEEALLSVWYPVEENQNQRTLSPGDSWRVSNE